MIVVSGVLVLVALVFLVIGLFGEGLTLIWLSIGTSLVAGVFLLLGALQRRGTPATAADSGPTGPEMLERVTAVSVRPREDAATEDVAEAPASGGQLVAVVPGRPRYHVDSCRFLAGRPDVEKVDVEMARGEGYTACGVCKPDQALAAAAEASLPAAEEAMADEPESTTDVEETAILAETAAPGRARKAPAKKAAAATKAPAKKAAAATKAAPAKATAAAAKPAASGSTVVVIPDRGKFHVETCRFVKDVPGTLTVTKATAKRQGYAPCGVCKP